MAAFAVKSWNEQLCLHVAKEVKKRWPDCLIVFGGTQVPHHPEAFFAEHSFIDVAVRAEGEGPFKSIMERYMTSREFDGIPAFT